MATAELAYFNKFGQLVWSAPRGLAAGLEFPHYAISRGRLQGLLLEAVRTRLGPQAIHVGHQLHQLGRRMDLRWYDDPAPRGLESRVCDRLVPAVLRPLVRRSITELERRAHSIPRSIEVTRATGGQQAARKLFAQGCRNRLLARERSLDPACRVRGRGPRHQASRRTTAPRWSHRDRAVHARRGRLP